MDTNATALEDTQLESNSEVQPTNGTADIAVRQTARPKPPRPRKPNYAEIHARPLPLQTYPLPAFHPSQPLSLIHLAYTILRQLLSPPSSHPPTAHLSYYSINSRSVHVTDHATARALWESGFFGKGSLSRSEPEWLDREKKRLGQRGKSERETALENTQKRRAERHEMKRERARAEREALEEQLRKEGRLEEVKVVDEKANGITEHGQAVERTKSLNESVSSRSGRREESSDVSVNEALLKDQEHLQLMPSEAFFLAYALGTLSVSHPKTRTPFSTLELLTLFRRTSFFPPLPTAQPLPPDDPFILKYITYHHFRSLGWVVRSGVKFSVDFLLYIRGPAFTHAEFAVLIIPDYGAPGWQATEARRKHAAKHARREWWWMHCANRVQSQVKKTLVLCYVEVPAPEDVQGLDGDIGALLRRYKVREFTVRRWTPQRNSQRPESKVKK